MKQLLSIIILLVFSLSAMGQKHDIVAIVNDEPITFNEFQARKKMLMVLNNVENLSSIQDKHFSDLTIRSLIDEFLLSQNYKGEEISQEEINNAVKSIEERNKMPSGYLLQYLRSRGVDVNSFISQIKSELVKMNILSGLYRSVQVSPREVDTAVLSLNQKDVEVSVRVFVSKNKDHNALTQMNKLKKRVKGCAQLNKSLYADFADVRDIRGKLSDLSSTEQTIVKDLDVRQVSNVFMMNDRFYMISVCDKKILDISDDENTYVVNFLANKKLSQKSQKLFQDMYKKSYIKIMLP